MRFSEVFKIKRQKQDDWFDPVLSVDTKLFVDPFLIYAGEKGAFSGSHKEVISFFNDVFSLIAKTKGDRKHLFWRRALSLLVFPEAEELCLGYATGTTKGSGSGAGFARVIAEALWEAVEAGIKEFTHFEEIGIMREGIGADRISDITANLLRQRLVRYTGAVCEKYGVSRVECKYPRGAYSAQYQPSPGLAHPRLRPARGLRIRRGLLQSPASALLPGLPHSRGVRGGDVNQGAVHTNRLRNLSAKSGQPQCL